MKRSGVRLVDVADSHNLARAFHACGKGQARPAGCRDVPGGPGSGARPSPGGDPRRDGRGWPIAPLHDPRSQAPRNPCARFRGARAAPRLDGADGAGARSHADLRHLCLPGAQGHARGCPTGAAALRRQPWYAQIDIRSYFASIDHAILLGQLERRFKDRGCWRWSRGSCGAIRTSPGRGLPIGALTSQHFANFYLAEARPAAARGCRVRGFVRYMDDLIWWDEDRAGVRRALQRAHDHLQSHLLLTIKQPGAGRAKPGRAELLRLPHPAMPPAAVAPAQAALCRPPPSVGAGVSGGSDRWASLQAGYARRLALTTAHADAKAWRREQLRRHALEPTLHEALTSSPGCRPIMHREPRHPRRVLEQRRAERARGVPEQERARRPQRQPRFSLCPSSRPDRMVRT